MNFTWDPDKASANLEKHGITFQEASTVFGDPLALTFMDRDHSAEELRYLTFGLSQAGQFLLVVHTLRGRQNRIISARRMSKRERVLYEEG